MAPWVRRRQAQLACRLLEQLRSSFPAHRYPVLPHGGRGSTGRGRQLRQPRSSPTGRSPSLRPRSRLPVALPDLRRLAGCIVCISLFLMGIAATLRAQLLPRGGVCTRRRSSCLWLVHI